VKDNDNDRLLSGKKTRERYGVSDQTIWRWDHDPSLKFPKAIRIRGRKFRRLRELLAWEASREEGGDQ
jgi:predicted DNA-binding transcriptional regulator AlpA